MSTMASLQEKYPWTSAPLIICPPMRLITTAPLAVRVTQAGGIGFIAGGSDISNLASMLQEASQMLEKDQKTSPVVYPSDSNARKVLPVGVGLLLWSLPSEEFLKSFLETLKQWPVSAVWLYAHSSLTGLGAWAKGIRDAQPSAHLWVQIGSVKEALEVEECCHPDVIVVQGIDAGGHGLNHGAGIVSLFPEVHDALKREEHNPSKKGQHAHLPHLVAAGGISDERGIVAALALDAEGVVLGTRYLAAPETNIKDGYRNEVVRASDGGQNTVRTRVYDTIRGTPGWPERYGGRSVINQTFRDAASGMSDKDNQQLYKQAEKLGDQGWGPGGRMTTWAGTNVGLVNKIQSAGEITTEVRERSKAILKNFYAKL